MIMNGGTIRQYFEMGTDLANKHGLGEQVREALEKATRGIRIHQ